MLIFRILGTQVQRANSVSLIWHEHINQESKPFIPVILPQIKRHRVGARKHMMVQSLPYLAILLKYLQSSP